MHYERVYIVKWTWHYLDKKYCYSECKYFDTESEANQFFFGLFHDPTLKLCGFKKFVKKLGTKGIDKPFRMCYNTYRK